jgi:hypothetical protein
MILGATNGVRIPCSQSRTRDAEKWLFVMARSAIFSGGDSGQIDVHKMGLTGGRENACCGLNPLVDYGVGYGTNFGLVC